MPWALRTFQIVLFAQQCLLILIRAGGVLPAVMTEWSRAVDGGTRWVAVEPQPVVAVPLLQHLGVDDDPSFAVGAPRVTDAELTAGGRRAAVSGDHVGRAEPLESVGAQVGQHEFDLVALRYHAQAFVFEKDLDVREAGHALAQHLIDRGLVEELLRRMPGPA